MPGLIQELRDSRTFDVNVTGGSATFRYVLTGEPDEAAAYDQVLAESPGVWYGYTRDKIDMSNRPGLGTWFPVVTYSLPVYQPGAPLPGPGSGEVAGVDTAPTSSPSSGSPGASDPLDGVSISIALENQTVYSSRRTVSTTVVAGRTAPNFAQLVNVSKENGVQGAEIGIPVATIVYKRTLPYLTAGYFRNLLYICGRVNEDPWWLFKEEEALFAGANGQSKGTNEFEINYEFKYQKSRIGLDIRGDGTLIVPEKRGWHYLWTANEKKTVGGVETIQPFAAYVEEMYDKIAFTWLGI